MSLARSLKSAIGKFSNQDNIWVQYLKDHRYYLLEDSQRVEIPLADMFNFRYRPEDYLASKGYENSMVWIVLWLNQIHSHMNFVDLRYILLPDRTKLNAIHGEYVNYRAHLSVTHAKLTEA